MRVADGRKHATSVAAEKICRIEFTGAGAHKLEQMTQEFGASSEAELVQNALALYDYILKELEPPGRRLAILQGWEVKKFVTVSRSASGKSSPRSTRQPRGSSS